MTDKAIKMTAYNVWERDTRGPYLIVSTTARIDAEKFSDENTFITENDFWVELPE